uniref:ATP synthase F0 subunit 6 n=1 Tax=Azygia hwangtsiyui TaxID=2752791 RepID=A0A7D5TJU6_9TREM|nr:ATP synthase F0 subunit 6 [Azygia hwangtsiyui]QLH90211.1 ATP synthase F0 subunit 6 [Azygia hwangtsiyui]
MSGTWGVVVYRSFISFVSGVSFFFYHLALFCVCGGFLYLRFPYFYGVYGFMGFLFLSIFPLFCCLFVSRFNVGGWGGFFSEFVPVGSPLWVAPFVCLAETVSYLIRPVVLLLRPFLNLSAGAFGGVVLGGMGLVNPLIIIFLFFLFFYEVFVALVHWFIVSEILSFTTKH